MKRAYPFWICRRWNPQLGTYYIAEGQMSKTAANRREGPGYGRNAMISFDSEDAYKLRIEELRAAGEDVQT